MRSRYTAYALQNIDYIIRTTHPMSPHYQLDHTAWEAQLRMFSTMIRFEKLEVLSTESGDDQDTAWVTYRATMFQGDRDISAVERGKFKRLHGRWLYLAEDNNQSASP